MVGWSHLKDEVKRPSPKPEEKDSHHAHDEGHPGDAAAGASGGRKRGYRHGDVNRGGAKFVVGLGADDVDESMRGDGTKHLLELLWTMRSDEFEKKAIMSEKQR
jgi:hypothetical protein